MNGCILIGTIDGANVKIRQEVGEENFFLFGARAHEIAGLRKERDEGKVSNQHYQYNISQSRKKIKRLSQSIAMLFKIGL